LDISVFNVLEKKVEDRRFWTE